MDIIHHDEDEQDAAQGRDRSDGQKKPVDRLHARFERIQQVLRSHHLDGRFFVRQDAPYGRFDRLHPVRPDHGDAEAGVVRTGHTGKIPAQTGKATDVAVFQLVPRLKHAGHRQVDGPCRADKGVRFTHRKSMADESQSVEERLAHHHLAVVHRRPAGDQSGKRS